MAEKRKWDLRGTRQGREGGRCSLCVGEGIIEHRFRKEKAEKMIYTVHSKFLVMNRTQPIVQHLQI
jgi:hypothetical protein